MKTFSCDYDYKCLNQGMIYDGHAVPCPHLMECSTFIFVRNFVDKSVARSSVKKNRKGWSHANVRRQDLRDVFIDSLKSGFHCTYCRKQMTMEPNYLNSVTLDHIIARSLGGDNSKGNLVLCCHECNREKAKGEMTAVETMRANGEVALANAFTTRSR